MFLLNRSASNFQSKLRIKFNPNVQVSESLPLGIVLSLSGGFMDAYTYVCRGGVFANAQTGNMLLFGVKLSEGNWLLALRYLFPVLAFAVGITVSDLVRYRFKHNPNIIHWRQITILAEAIILCGVAFIPQPLNLLANSLVSFACGIQVESFRKINGTGIATTMCIGNLRAATEALTQYTVARNLKAGNKAVLFLGIIAVFIVGAVLGNLCVSLWHEAAIIVSALLMFLGFLLMFGRSEDQIYSL